MDCIRPQEPSSGNQEGGLLQLQTREPLIAEEDTQELRQVMCVWGLHPPLQVTPFSFLPGNNSSRVVLASHPQEQLGHLPVCSSSCSRRREGKAIPIPSPCALCMQTHTAVYVYAHMH